MFLLPIYIYVKHIYVEITFLRKPTLQEVFIFRAFNFCTEKGSFVQGFGPF